MALGGLALWCLQAWRYRSAEVFAGGPVWVFGPYDEHPSPGVTAQVADSASGPGTGLRLSTDLLDHWPVGPDVYPTGGWGSAHLSVWAWVLGAVLLVALVKVAARR
ncbi:hypothetical protein CLV35_0125 [Motilibacter peucedani]|uniref:Uncharacterized protein n=1 Tax=Motilibacter peucedani TaxID=598650 RepID=A0A420XVJ5_9ACTN|nr:hypothetical protein CLV35_0125 [Motilibacter peucedani]